MTKTRTIDTRTLQLPDAEITYDVRDGAGTDSATLLIIGQPMCADGFAALADELTDRTVVTYDPRGLGRSTRSDGSDVNDPALQASDLHALIGELGTGPVDIFASSGGAVTGLALVLQHPEDVRVLVAHEPPIFAVLPDAEQAFAASKAVDDTYQERGFGAGLAQFISLISWKGEFNDEYFAQPAPDPANFGLPSEDDGSRNDPLMSGASAPVTALDPDTDALTAASTRVVVGVGEQSREIVTGRVAAALAARLGTEPVVFRGGHGGFSADEWGVPGDPAKFADQLRAALA